MRAMRAIGKRNEQHEQGDIEGNMRYTDIGHLVLLEMYKDNEETSPDTTPYSSRQRAI